MREEAIKKEGDVSVEESVTNVLIKVLDIKPAEIEPSKSLDSAYGVDSTEMVEISVGLKKALGISLADNELKKTHSFNDIIKIIKSKGLIKA